MENHIRIARGFTKLLETSIGIGNYRFGLEPLLGTIPVIGDLIGLIFSFYLVWIGTKLQIPEKEITKMVRNILVDFLGGLVPFLGDIFDFAFKANSKNMRILEKYIHNNVIEGEVLDRK